MNQSQVKYIRNRAETILTRKKGEITEKYTTPAKSLNDAEKIVAIEEGKFTIKNTMGVWYSRIDFGETFKTIDVDKSNADWAKIDAIFEKMMDELILGDKEEALNLLREFENYVG